MSKKVEQRNIMKIIEILLLNRAKEYYTNNK